MNISTPALFLILANFLAIFWVGILVGRIWERRVMLGWAIKTYKEAVQKVIDDMGKDTLILKKEDVPGFIQKVNQAMHLRFQEMMKKARWN